MRSHVGFLHVEDAAPTWIPQEGDMIEMAVRNERTTPLPLGATYTCELTGPRDGLYRTTITAAASPTQPPPPEPRPRSLA